MAAFVFGAAAGAIFGILFAPDKGTATRSKITDKGKKTFGEVNDFIHKGKDRINGMKEEIAKLFSECEEEEEVV